MGQDSVQRARQLDDDVVLGMSLLAYGLTFDAAESGLPYAEAIACTERSGDLYIRVAILNDAGFRGLETGNISAARAYLEAALRTAEAVGMLHLVARENLAKVLRAEGDLDGARSAFQDLARNSRRVGDKRSLSGAMHGLACLAADLGDWHRASALHGAAQALLDQIGSRMAAFDARRRQESLDQLMAALGEKQLKHAYYQGTVLSLDGAIDLALGQ